VLGSLQTARLSLRPIALDDVDLLVELDSDAEVMRFLSGRPSSREEVETTVREHLGWRWIAADRATGEFVGWFGLVPGDAGNYEIGYRLVRRWWGRGLASEGAQALIDAAFSTLRASRVTAQTMAVNRRSRLLMERCGMLPLRSFHVQWADPLPGSEQGEVEYHLTRDAWQQGRN
jgi:RimJ/RimL family protein N-acetyltransferase